jgi:hypothetical protein
MSVRITLVMTFLLPMPASSAERDGDTAVIVSLWFAWAFLVTVGRSWPLFYYLPPSAHHLDDVKEGGPTTFPLG